MTKASKARAEKRFEKKVQKRRAVKVASSKRLQSLPTKDDHEQLIRVYGFYFAIAGALDGNPDLLGRAKGVAKGMLDELCMTYTKLYGEEATEALLQKFSDEFNQKESEVTEDGKTEPTKAGD